MMRYRTVTVVLILLLLGSPGSRGQGIFRHPGIFDAPPAHAGYLTGEGTDRLMTPGQYRLNLDLGSGFSSPGGQGALFTHYLAPSLNYLVSKRFSLQAGAVFSTLQAGGNLQPVFRSASGEALNSYLLFASGSYLLKPGLTLSGVVYKQFRPESPFGTELARGNEYHGMTMNLDLRVTDAFRIGASFNYNNRPIFSFPGRFMYFHDPFIPWP